jgi:NACalpha-BTF3-like transcription factor
MKDADGDIPLEADTKNEEETKPVETSTAQSTTATTATTTTSTVSAEGLNEKDIEVVMGQTQKSREEVIAALKETGGDMVTAILNLS